MQPLDRDTEYTTDGQRPAGSRFNFMFILPIIGVLLVLLFISAAVFQFSLADLVSSLVGLMLLLFVIAIAMLFWSMAPRSNT